MFRAKVWPAQVAIHRTVEVNFDIPSMDEEQPYGGYKQTSTVRSQAELEMIAAELQMKTDLQIWGTLRTEWRRTPPDMA